MKLAFTFYFICISSFIFSQKPGLQIQIEATDLSEDMNTLASGNDELITLIYHLDSSKTLKEPVYIQEFEFDKENKFIELSTRISSEQKCQIMIVLLERDTERPLKQIDPIIRIYYREIMEAYQKHDLLTIRELLGDEDILGIRKLHLPLSAKMSFRFRGRLKMDKYEYHLKVN